MESNVFRQIYTAENTPLRIQITILENTATVILLENSNAWKSIVPEEKLKTFAGEHQLTLEDYNAKLLHCIKSAGSNLTFVLKNDSFIIHQLLENSLKVKFFICKLDKVNYNEQVEQILDRFSLENTELLEKVKTLTEEKEEIDKCKTCCESKLKELVQKKHVDEEEQFARFVLILNEKKRRIQHLTELLEAFRNGRPTVNPPITAKSRKRKNVTNDSKPAKKLETISESDHSNNSDAEDTTDSEENTAKKKLLPDASKPSTSIEDFDLDFLEDDVPSKSHTLPKRVRREVTTNDVIVKPSTSKTEVEPIPIPPEPKGKSAKSGRKTPEIDINTQELLDML